MNNNKRKKVLGYDVDIMSFNEALNYVLSKISTKQGLHIITINPEIIEQARNNSELDKILKNSELVLADGSGIKLALGLKGIKQERIPGIDFALSLIEKCNNFKYPIALIGAKKEVINLTKDNLKTKFKDLNITYIRNGYFEINDEEEIIKDIKNSDPTVIFVALGAPKQEIFIDKCRKEMPEKVFIGIGGSFDVWAGIVERAPELYRILGIEWLYRTIKQPQRLKRIYKTLPIFAIKAIIDSVKYNFFMRKENE